MAGKREIPTRGRGIFDAVKSAQVRMFDLAKNKHGFSLKVLHLETDIPMDTLRDWITGKSGMPLAGFVALSAIKEFPNELLSLPFEAAGRSVCDAEPEETDQDDAAVAALEYALKWARARHPSSPSGVRIDHTERPDLELAAEGLADKVGKVAGR
jgi:hypothetical protein